jgi:hypothetical protein
LRSALSRKTEAKNGKVAGNSKKVSAISGILGIKGCSIVSILLRKGQ